MKHCFLIIIAFALSCTSANEKAEKPSDKFAEIILVDSSKVLVNSTLNDTSTAYVYPWKEAYDAENTLVNRIAPPPGFTRPQLLQSAFSNWLRHLPLKPEGTSVYLHDGSLKGNQNAHYLVVDIDPGRRDLQQCADAVMRLKAEYHFSRKEYDHIHFNFTSGDEVKFSDWAKGRKPIIKGNKVVFTNESNTKDYSYLNFRKYLVQIFSYAGTASLTKELKPIKPQEVEIGDVFIKGGFPGHAVIVVDLALNDKGEKQFLLAQSYMPAQDIHILKNPDSEAPWYPADFGDQLMTPEWTFSSSELKRF